jgi:hypothetical protein
MKQNSRTHFSFASTVIFGSFVLMVSSAFVTSSSIQVNYQRQSPITVNSTSRTPFSLDASSVSNINADSTIRIAFALGTTSGTYYGSLASGGVQSYVLNAAWNQVMMVNVNSPDNNLYLEIYGQWDGIYLARFSSALTSWRGWLPRTQDYIVKVYNSGGSTENYSLFVEIPARIQFARGAYSGSVYGRGSAAQTISYVLYAFAGQTMTATLYSSTSSVYLSIYGFSGGQSLVTSSSANTTWTGTLPQTQEYIIDAVQNGSWVDFTLTVTIV